MVLVLVLLQNLSTWTLLDKVFSPNRSGKSNKICCVPLQRVFYVCFPCLKIDTGDEDGDQSEGSDTEDNGTVLLSKVTEMRLVPSDSNQCTVQLHSYGVLFIVLFFNTESHSFFHACSHIKTFFLDLNVYLTVDTLFEIFCKCAEMNPEPVEGEYQSSALGWIHCKINSFGVIVF